VFCINSGRPLTGNNERFTVRATVTVNGREVAYTPNLMQIPDRVRRDPWGRPENPNRPFEVAYILSEATRANRPRTGRANAMRNCPYNNAFWALFNQPIQNHAAEAGRIAARARAYGQFVARGFGNAASANVEIDYSQAVMNEGRFGPIYIYHDVHTAEGHTFGDFRPVYANGTWRHDINVTGGEVASVTHIPSETRGEGRSRIFITPNAGVEEIRTSSLY